MSPSLKASAVFTLLRLFGTMPTGCRSLTRIHTQGFHMRCPLIAGHFSARAAAAFTRFTCGRGRIYCRYKELLYVLCSLFAYSTAAPDLIRTPLVTLYFYSPFPPPHVSISSLPLPLQISCVSPCKRPLAFTACCSACLSLFYQPLFALYGCSSCI